MSEVPLQGPILGLIPRTGPPRGAVLVRGQPRVKPHPLREQGYLAHQKTHPPRTLP